MTKTRRNILILASASALLLAGATALFAAPTMAGGLFGGHFGHRGFGHGAKHDPEHRREHLRAMTDRMLSEVDASDEQIDQVAEILGAAFEDLHGLRGDHGAQREAFSAALTASEIDREALETLRSEGMAMAEQASSRLVSALADAAAVLTPEQRAEFASVHDSFHGFHRRGR